MNEKDYGGTLKYGTGRNSGKFVRGNSDNAPAEVKKRKNEILEVSEEDSEEVDKGKILKAGKIASELREYARQIVKPGVLLLDIAEKIEEKTEELGGKPAFPVNTSINDVAAHYTPLPGDKTPASGLLKVDFGVHVDGWVSDTALSFDLSEGGENKKLIESAEKALANALDKVKPGVSFSEIGKAVQDTIESFGFSPIINLSGHSISRYDLHSGFTIPNYDNKSGEVFESGTYAVEPFATSGNGKVYDGKPSGIYSLVNEKNVRSPIARKILDYIIGEYSTLPFCSRWIVKKFGSIGLFGLKQLEDNGNLHQFEQLVEVSHKNVAQAEHTVFISGNKVEITTA